MRFRLNLEVTIPDQTRYLLDVPFTKNLLIQPVLLQLHLPQILIHMTRDVPLIHRIPNHHKPKLVKHPPQCLQLLRLNHLLPEQTAQMLRPTIIIHPIGFGAISIFEPFLGLEDVL